MKSMRMPWSARMVLRSVVWFISMSRVAECSAKMLIFRPLAVVAMESSTRPMSGGLIWKRISESPFRTALEICRAT